MTDPTDLPAALRAALAAEIAALPPASRAEDLDAIQDLTRRAYAKGPARHATAMRAIAARALRALGWAPAPPPGPGWYVLQNADPPAFRFYSPLTLILGQDESVRITPDVPRWLDADELAALTAAWPTWAPAAAPEQWTLDPAGNPPGGLEAGG